MNLLFVGIEPLCIISCFLGEHNRIKPQMIYMKFRYPSKFSMKKKRYNLFRGFFRSPIKVNP